MTTTSDPPAPAASFSSKFKSPEQPKSAAQPSKPIIEAVPLKQDGKQKSKPQQPKQPKESSKREPRKIDAAVVEEAQAMYASGQRPHKPDQEAYSHEIEEIEKELNQVRDKLSEVRDRIEKESSGSQQNQQRQELRAQLDKVKAEQVQLEETKQRAVDEYKSAQEVFKKKSDDLKNLRDKFPFRSPQDIDRKCAELEAQVSTGMHKVSDEKRMLAEITSLKKQKKEFEVFAPMEAAVDVERRRVDKCRDALSAFDPETRRLKQAFGKTLAELKVIEAANKTVRGKRDVIIKERSELQARQNSLYEKKRELNQNYYYQRDLFNAYSNEDRKHKEVEYKKEREELQRQRRLERVREAKETAAIPAFESEIHSCNALIKMLHHIQPSEDPQVMAIVQQSPGSHASPTAKVARKVTEEQKLPKGVAGSVALKKKTDDDDLVKVGGKLQKKKQQVASQRVADKEVKLDLTVLDQFWKLKIDAPTTRADIPNTVSSILEKRTKFVESQDQVTKDNIRKAVELEQKLMKEEEERQAAELNGRVVQDEEVENGH